MCMSIQYIIVITTETVTIIAIILTAILKCVRKNTEYIILSIHNV